MRWATLLTFGLGVLGVGLCLGCDWWCHRRAAPQGMTNDEEDEHGYF